MIEPDLRRRGTRLRFDVREDPDFYADFDRADRAALEAYAAMHEFDALVFGQLTFVRARSGLAYRVRLNGFVPEREMTTWTPVTTPTLAASRLDSLDQVMADALLEVLNESRLVRRQRSPLAEGP